MKNKRIIGRVDKADLPEFRLNDIDIKVDTGAYTSSIHCNHVELLERNGKSFVRFTLLDPSHPQYNNLTFQSGNFIQKQVKNSFGTSEKRFVIRTHIVLFRESYPIELSLSERGEMKYPILLGRKLLKGKFTVDVSRYNLSYKDKIGPGKKTTNIRIQKDKL